MANTWVCRCGYRVTKPAEVTGVLHTCPSADFDMVRLELEGHLLYCPDCRELFAVTDDQLPDGEIWYCESCAQVRLPA